MGSVTINTNKKTKYNTEFTISDLFTGGYFAEAKGGSAAPNITNIFYEYEKD